MAGKAKTPAKPAAKAAAKPAAAPAKPAAKAAAAKGGAKAAAKEVKIKPMTKTQLVKHISERFQLLQKTAGEILEELAALAVMETKKAGEFVFPGIGKLVKAQRKARTGINPKTKEKIKIPAKTVVKFRVAKAAKESIGGGK